MTPLHEYLMEQIPPESLPLMWTLVRHAGARMMSGSFPDYPIEQSITADQSVIVFLEVRVFELLISSEQRVIARRAMAQLAEIKGWFLLPKVHSMMFYAPPVAEQEIES